MNYLSSLLILNLSSFVSSFLQGICIEYRLLVWYIFSFSPLTVSFHCFPIQKQYYSSLYFTICNMLFLSGYLFFCLNLFVQNNLCSMLWHILSFFILRFANFLIYGLMVFHQVWDRSQCFLHIFHLQYLKIWGFVHFFPAFFP